MFTFVLWGHTFISISVSYLLLIMIFLAIFLGYCKILVWYINARNCSKGWRLLCKCMIQLLSVKPKLYNNFGSVENKATTKNILERKSFDILCQKRKEKRWLQIWKYPRKLSTNKASCIRSYVINVRHQNSQVKAYKERLYI